MPSARLHQASRPISRIEVNETLNAEPEQPLAGLAGRSFEALIGGLSADAEIGAGGWCGIDLVNVASFEAAMTKTGGRLAEKCFTDAERADASERVERLAVRWAVKEAVAKALGTGFMTGIGFRDVEVVLNEDGAPSVVLHGPAEEAARERGFVRWSVSASHDGGFAIAMVIAFSDATEAG